MKSPRVFALTARSGGLGVSHILAWTRGYAVWEGSEMPENADSFKLQHKEKAAT